jgi:hypothetical protein
VFPWLPTRDFSTKGFFLGGLVALGFGLVHVSENAGKPWIYLMASLLAYVSALPALTAFLALNFTGATTFTSRTGVKKEIRTYFPVMVWMLGLGMLCFIASIILSIIII